MIMVVLVAVLIMFAVVVEAALFPWGRGRPSVHAVLIYPPFLRNSFM